MVILQGDRYGPEEAGSLDARWPDLYPRDLGDDVLTFDPVVNDRTEDIPRSRDLAAHHDGFWAKPMRKARDTFTEIFCSCLQCRERLRLTAIRLRNNIRDGGSYRTVFIAHQPM